VIATTLRLKREDRSKLEARPKRRAFFSPLGRLRQAKTQLVSAKSRGKLPQLA